MKSENFLNWLKAALIRAGKTFVQAAIGTVSTGALISEVNFLLAFNTAGLSAVLSLLTSIAGLPELEGKIENKYAAIAVRAAKTFVQTVLSYTVNMAVFTDVPWTQALSAAVVAAVVSIGYNATMADLPEVGE